MKQETIDIIRELLVDKLKDCETAYDIVKMYSNPEARENAMESMWKHYLETSKALHDFEKAVSENA